MNAEMKWTPGPLAVFPTSEDRQFIVTQPQGTLCPPEVEWEDFYVSFSGYFGKHGPHVFAAAPEMAEALRALPTEWLNSGVLSSNDKRIDHVPIKMSIEGTSYEAEMTVGDLRRARAALSKAGG